MENLIFYLQKKMDLTVPNQVTFGEVSLDCRTSIDYLGNNETKVTYSLKSKLDKKVITIAIICAIKNQQFVLEMICIYIERKRLDIRATFIVKSDINITSPRATVMMLLSQDLFNLLNEISDTLYENINNYSDCTKRLDNELPEWTKLHKFTVSD